MTLKLLIPKNLYITILKNKKNILYIYNKNYFYLIKLNKKNFKIIFVIKQNNIIIIKFCGLHFLRKINLIKNILKLWLFYFFKKIKFSGKGFRIKKNFIKKNFILEFNKSHITLLLLKKILLKKIKKTKFLILFNNVKYIKKINNILIWINKVNKYTKRGLRNSRQLIKKKTNKKNVVT